MWLLNAALFFVLFAFALNNQDSITLNLFFGRSWQAPLVVVLLLTVVTKTRFSLEWNFKCYIVHLILLRSNRGRKNGHQPYSSVVDST